MKSITTFVNALLISSFLIGCSRDPRPGDFVQRQGDEIVVCGQLVHTGAPVVLWMDPGGYDAYRVEKRFDPFEESDWDSIKDSVDSPNRYGLRYKGGHFTSEQIEMIRGGGWPLDLLQDTVDLFVIHFDVCGTSERCFDILHDHRCLSVHFMLDVDGTIYQTLDLKERAWHAGTANDRSIGIEIANMGAYPIGDMRVLGQWYKETEKGTLLTLPESRGDGGIRTMNFQGRPMRDELVSGTVNGSTVQMYDFTPQQYESLIKLTATLCKVFPRIECDYPKDADGHLITRELTDEEFAEFSGIIGHFHETRGKIDPGPAFQFDYVTQEAKKLMK